MSNEPLDLDALEKMLEKKCSTSRFLDVVAKNLLAELRALRQRRERLEEVLKRVEWGPSSLDRCPACAEDRFAGHKDDCLLKAALGDKPGEGT